MKRLLLIWLFSASLSGFSQDKIDTIHIGRLKLIFRNDTLYNQYFAGPMLKDNDPKPDTLKTGWVDTKTWTLYKAKPDTLAATLIVYYDRGSTFLHATRGYVVRQWIGGDAVYLDRKKRPFKAPWEVLTYKVKK